MPLPPNIRLIETGPRAENISLISCVSTAVYLAPLFVREPSQIGSVGASGSIEDSAIWALVCLFRSCGVSEMRFLSLRAALLAAALLFVSVSSSSVARSTEVSRPNIAAAQAAFDRMSVTDRVAMHIGLIATGDFNAMIGQRLAGRLYDAIARFQAEQGLPVTGVPTAETFTRLQTVASAIMSLWGGRWVNHPTVVASLWTPSGFGMLQQRSKRGWAFANLDDSLSADFSFFPDGEATMGAVYDRLSTPSQTRRIDMRMIKSNFFAVSGGTEHTGFYSRYIPISGGAVGFTLAWDAEKYPLGYRMAVFMANSLSAAYANNATTPPIAQQPVTPTPAPPPQTANNEPPNTAANPVWVTGSAFFVTSDGALVTNHHVVKGCSSASIAGRGSATIVALDARNDLALLRLDAKPTDMTAIQPVAFRSSPTQLGETAYALGFPYSGALDNGVNFTNGMVSSLAGMDNDSTEFQLTAAVQPGNSGGPVLDQGGSLIGVTVARMSELAALKATGTIPQNVNFGIKAEVAASFLRANGVTPVMVADSPPVPTTKIALAGKAVTAQVICLSTAPTKD